ncbi:MAG: zf-HC2 domain-containing protein [Planctomycetota bacterium]|nr:zf-HC2 domain-containing protein [Planctomycetota bacterium]
MSTDLEVACERVQTRLEQYIDGGLDPVEEARDRGHLEACASCRRERDRWLELHAAVRESTAASEDEIDFATRGLDERLMDVAAGARRSRFRRIAENVLTPVATVAAAVVGMLALQFGGIRMDLVVRVPEPDQLFSELELGVPDWSGILDGWSLGGGD